MPLSYVLGFPAVLVCIVATASMAFRFGWQFGAEPWEQWSFALGLAAMDVIKAFLLLAVAGAWRARQYGRIGVALTAFVVFTRPVAALLVRHGRHPERAQGGLTHGGRQHLQRPQS